jgi:hypothetical protein
MVASCINTQLRTPNYVEVYTTENITRTRVKKEAGLLFRGPFCKIIEAESVRKSNSHWYIECAVFRMRLLIVCFYVVSVLEIQMKRRCWWSSHLLLFSMAQQPLLGQGVFIIEVSLSNSDIPHSTGLLWTSDSPYYHYCKYTCTFLANTYTLFIGLHWLSTVSTLCTVTYCNLKCLQHDCL